MGHGSEHPGYTQVGGNVALFFVIRRLFSVVYLMSHPAVPVRLKVLPIFAFIYFIFPRDLIFDFRPGIGHLDDLVVIGVCLGFFINRGWRYVLEEQKRKEDSILADFEVLDRVDDAHPHDGHVDEEPRWDPADAPEDDRPPTEDLRNARR